MIERHAKYDFEWDGWNKYQYFSWQNKEEGIISFKGDAIKFQNGFGVFQRMNYSCVYDTLNKVVKEVIVEPIQ